MRTVLLDYEHAFDHPVTVAVTAGIGVLLVLALGIVLIAPFPTELRRDMRRRILSWMVMAPLIAGPILLGPGPAIVAVVLLALACLGEYARATGLFRERTMTAMVALSILLVGTAALDHWYRFFLALAPLGVVLIAAAATAADRPQGYIQRVGLGVLAHMLFAVGLGHAAYLANADRYRPILLALLVGVQINDVFAYCTGKAFGGRKLAPATSPGKTVAGSLGSLVLTTPLVATLGHFVFAGSALDHPFRLAVLGVLVSVTAQLGDLMVSSLKRDLGIKDMGVLIRGHGGVLDRANSLLLAAPAFFHYVNYFAGLGGERPVRILF